MGRLEGLEGVMRFHVHSLRLEWRRSFQYGLQDLNEESLCYVGRLL